MDRVSNYSCPTCGAYLLAHPSKVDWLKCPSCGFSRPSLKANVPVPSNGLKPPPKKQK